MAAHFAHMETLRPFVENAVVAKSVSTEIYDQFVSSVTAGDCVFTISPVQDAENGGAGPSASTTSRGLTAKFAAAVKSASTTSSGPSAKYAIHTATY